METALAANEVLTGSNPVPPSNSGASMWQHIKNFFCKDIVDAMNHDRFASIKQSGGSKMYDRYEPSHNLHSEPVDEVERYSKVFGL